MTVLTTTACARRYVLAGLLALFPARLPAAQAPVAQAAALPPAGVSYHQAQIEARFLSTPRVVTASDGRRHVAYELRITSFYAGNDPLKLVRLTIFAEDASSPLIALDGAALPSLLAQSAGKDDPGDGIAIPSGRGRTLFLWLALPPGTRPTSLRHQLTFRADKNDIQRADDIETPIIESPPVVIGPPLGGGKWLAVEGPGNHLSHHWGSPVAIDGKLTIPQRFAIDWFGLDARNHSVRGRHASLAATTDADWVGYGRDVLAVADGEVVDARDGVPNGKPLAPEQTPDDLTARTLYGNFVVLRIAPNVYVHYAHMQADSLAVRIGQRVRRGDVIGRLGQTGSAGAPHLHFHISDRSTFEQSDGLPFVIDAFDLVGHAAIEATFDPRKRVDSILTSPAKHRFELPLDGSVVVFP